MESCQYRPESGLLGINCIVLPIKTSVGGYNYFFFFMIAKLTLRFAVVAVDVNVEFSVSPAAQQCELLQTTLMIETAAKDGAKGNGIRHT